MNGPTKAALVGMEVVGVLVLQAVAMFLAYGHRMTTLMALSIPVALSLQMILFSQALRPVVAVFARSCLRAQARMSARSSRSTLTGRERSWRL